jgi:hypothetical protein
MTDQDEVILDHYPVEQAQRDSAADNGLSHKAILQINEVLRCIRKCAEEHKYELYWTRPGAPLLEATIAYLTKQGYKVEIIHEFFIIHWKPSSQ